MKLFIVPILQEPNISTETQKERLDAIVKCLNIKGSGYNNNVKRN